MSADQEPTLGEVMRGQARIEEMLRAYIADAEKQAHSFRNKLGAQDVAIALHGQKLDALLGLEQKVDQVTAQANKISGAWTLVSVSVAALIAWWKH